MSYLIRDRIYVDSKQFCKLRIGNTFLHHLDFQVFIQLHHILYAFA